jgi:chromosome partitioning protein
MKTITFANTKGGVGKTTTVVSVAAILRQRGFNVLLIDLDLQGNASAITLGREALQGNPKDIRSVLLREAKLEEVIQVGKFDLPVAPGTIQLVRVALQGARGSDTILKDQVAEYNRALREATGRELDLVLIDTGPGTPTLLLHALMASDGQVVPILAEQLSAEGLRDFTRLLKMIREVIDIKAPVLGIVPSKVDNRRGARTPRNLEIIEKAAGSLLFPPTCYVPENAEITDLRSMTALPSGSPAVDAYENMTDEILRRLDIPMEPETPYVGPLTVNGDK